MGGSQGVEGGWGVFSFHKFAGVEGGRGVCVSIETFLYQLKLFENLLYKLPLN